MKVIHIESGRHLYGGAKQVSYLIEGLNQKGVNNILICPLHSAIEQKCQSSIKRCYPLPWGGDLDLRLIWRIRRILQLEKPDLVHLHSRRGADVLGGIAARWAGVPVVLSRRVDNPEPWLWAGLKYQLYNRVICISDAIKQVLSKAGIHENKLITVRSAVSPQDYLTKCNPMKLHDTFGLSSEDMLIGVIAQLIPRKGHRYLLEAMTGLISQYPSIKLIVFGKGKELQNLQDIARKLNIQPHVIFAGFWDDVADFIPCLDLVVHPALIEGLGIALLQAAGSGVPVVAVDSGGMKESVEHGVTGLLVKPANAKALFEAIDQLLSDRELRLRMGEAGRARIERSFTVDVMVEGNLAVYRELMQSS